MTSATRFPENFKCDVFSSFSIQFALDDRQKFLWNTEVSFTEDYYNSLKNNAVPLERDALYALKHSARALDIYMWLASTFLWGTKPTTIRWTSLRSQFGDHQTELPKDGEPTMEMTGFKRAFKTALKQALDVYPKAKVSVVYGGIKLHPSPPPVGNSASGGSPDIWFNHQVLTQLSLPYRRIDPARRYERHSGNVHLRVDAGSVLNNRGEFVNVGLPYGAKSRLILLLLSSLAIKEQSRTILIDDSFRSFAKSCGITLSGSNIRQLKEQLLRLSAVHVHCGRR